MDDRTKKREEKGSRRRKDVSSFTHFKRILGYVWPHKRYLVPALICILIVAFTFSASIGSILPILTIMVQPQGLHGWAHEHVAEKRLNAELDIYTPAPDRQIPGVPAGAAKVLAVKPDSPLLAAGIQGDDYLLSVGEVDQDAVAMFGRLAGAPGDVSVVYRPAGGEARTTTVTLPPLELHYALLTRAIGFVPGGQAPDQRMRTLVYVLAGLLLLALFGNLARLFAEYLCLVANGRAIIDLRRQLYARVLNLPLSRFSQNTSDTMSRFVQDIQDILRGLDNFFQKVVTEPIKGAGVLTIALLINWKMTALLMIGLPIAAAVFRKLGKKVRRANRKLLVGYGQMLSVLESTLTGMRVVKGYMREDYERRRLFRIDRGLLKQQLKMGFIEAMTSPFVEGMGFLALGGVIIYFASQIIYGHAELGQFVTLLACYAGVFDAVRKLSTVYPKLQRANAAAERIFELIDAPGEYAGDEHRPRLGGFNESIVFDKVCYQYPGGNRLAVRDLSLTVRRGEIIALVGPNGSGKTTLLSLLPRFFPLTSGRILIDGQDTSDVALKSVREQFSLITQESVIFPDTVRANIAYGRRNATGEQILAAAQAAFADEFIRQMPEGYDTVVGEHGATLSGGQRQRIAIARAILRNSPIVIFDEATSQVDPESEMKIHEALDSFLRDRTAFIIAHRFSTVAGADRIVVMDDGAMVDVGTHEQLMRSCPLYQRLYETQFRESNGQDGDDGDVAASPDREDHRTTVG